MPLLGASFFKCGKTKIHFLTEGITGGSQVHIGGSHTGHMLGKCRTQAPPDLILSKVGAWADRNHLLHVNPHNHFALFCFALLHKTERLLLNTSSAHTWCRLANFAHALGQISPNFQKNRWAPIGLLPILLSVP